MTGQVRRIEVDGIPVLRAPAVDGRAAGGLVFRAGHADETLATRGLTHLVEHLALGFSDLTKQHANGSTGRTVTHFHVTGTSAEVVDFLRNVCASLRALPLERLETEKQILRTEAAGRSWGPAPAMAAWRHGAQGYGLASHLELGLGRIGPDDVEAWVYRHFVRENVVAWMASDDEPLGLDLTLPSGSRRPTPAATSVIGAFPAHYAGPDGVVVAESVVRRTTAANVYASVLEQALFRELRQDGGYSYTVQAHYEPRDGDHATIAAVADALPEKQDAVVGGVVDVLAALRQGTIREEDIAAAIRNGQTALSQPNAEAMRLPGAAADEVLGHAQPSTAELLAELGAVTPAVVQAVAAEAHESLIVQVPPRSLAWAGFTAAPYRSEHVVEGGTSVRYVEETAAAVTVGRDGVSFTHGDERSTVLWDEIAAVQSYPDGARAVIGLDGFQVRVEPSLLEEGGEGLVRTIDGRVPAELVVPMPPRQPDAIPRPQAPEPAARPAPAERGSVWGLRALRIVQFGLLILCAIALLALVAFTIDAISGSDAPDDGTWSEVAIFGAALVLLWLGKRGVDRAVARREELP